MGNELKMVQKQLLNDLFTKNWSIRKINRATKIHRSTIKRYKQQWKNNQHCNEVDTCCTNNQKIDEEINQNVPLNENKCPPSEVVHFEVPTDSDCIQKSQEDKSKSKAVPFDEIIREKSSRGQHAKSIYQDLVIDNDYKGSYDSIKRYINKIKKKSPKLYARIETGPGEEAQVDFGQGAPTLKNSRYCKPWLFVMTLSNSRNSYQEVVWKQDVETFVTCHENAFKFFGGAVSIVKLDNLKSGVLKAHLYEPELNPVYYSFSQHYNFIPLPCKVRTPEHKGKVESGVKYIQNNALKGKRFETLEEQNTYLRKWHKTWALTRIHGTTKRQVLKMFEQEKPSLQPLAATSFNFFKIGQRKVNAADSHIEISGAYYPIPPEYMGHAVTVHFNSKWIKVYNTKNELIQHLSTITKGRFHPDNSCLPEHKTRTQDQYLSYLFDRCKQIGPSVLDWAKSAEEHRKQRAYRAIQGVVALSKKYPENHINQACYQCINDLIFTYHIVKQRVEQIQLNKKIQIEIQFSQENEIIRPPDEYKLLAGGE